MRDELVGVLHFLDRFGARKSWRKPCSPIVENAVAQPILIDRRELMLQRPVKVLDNLLITPHRVTQHLPYKRRDSLLNVKSPFARRLTFD
jgi:hypothetical protein